MYQANTYPGIVTDIDDMDIEVKCMNSVGVNRFYWPQFRDDVCWYTIDDVCWYTIDEVLFLIPEPEKVGSRHVQGQPHPWTLIQQYLLPS